MGAKMLRLARRQGGFTLIELMVVMAIMTVLAGIVVGGVVGTTDVGRDAAASSDQNTIQSAVDRFYSDADPQEYPVVSEANDSVNWSATLPQDSSRTFVPLYLKEIPRSAGSYEWHIDVTTGKVYKVAIGGLADVQASSAQLSVKAADLVTSANTVYTLKVNLNLGDAATKKVKVIVPKGYTLTLPSVGTTLGSYSVDVVGDGEWPPHSRAGIVRVNAIDPKRWEVVETVDGQSQTTHTLDVVQPTSSTYGQVLISFGRTLSPFGGVDKKSMQASAIMVITLGTSTVKPFTNPAEADSYTWSAFQNTTLDLEGVFNKMGGTQKVIIP